MLKELDDIENPTFRERFDRSIVKPILWSKQKFGMGLEDIINEFKEYKIDLNTLRDYFPLL